MIIKEVLKTYNSIASIIFFKKNHKLIYKESAFKAIMLINKIKEIVAERKQKKQMHDMNKLNLNKIFVCISRRIAVLLDV